MEILWAILAFAGPIGVLGGYIVYMVKKKGWVVNQLVMGGVLALLIASAVPDLPQATNNAVMGFIQAFQDAK